MVVETEEMSGLPDGGDEPAPLADADVAPLVDLAKATLPALLRGAVENVTPGGRLALVTASPTAGVALALVTVK